MENLAQKEKVYNRWIIALSIAIPVAVAFLFTIRIPDVPRLGFLPPTYAAINAITAVLLFTAVIQVKKGNRKLHEKLIKVCIVLSVIFLVLYVLYHATSDSTKLGSPYIFIIDKDRKLRGRDDDEDYGVLYGYDSSDIAELADKMKDDVKIVLAEYRLALKKNNADRKK